MAEKDQKFLRSGETLYVTRRQNISLTAPARSPSSNRHASGQRTQPVFYDLARIDRRGVLSGRHLLWINPRQEIEPHVRRNDRRKLRRAGKKSPGLLEVARYTHRGKARNWLIFVGP